MDRHVVPFHSSTRHDARILSNFYEQSPISWCGQYFLIGTEAAYQWAKIRLIVPEGDASDTRRKQYIARLFAARTPLQCKQIGNEVKSRFSNQYRKFQLAAKHIMRSIIFAKVTQFAHIQNFLIQTGDRLLVETNDRSGFWGVDMSEDQIFRAVQDKFRRENRMWEPPLGSNALGKIYMEIRSHFCGGIPLSKRLLVGDSMVSRVQFEGYALSWSGANIDLVFDLLELCVLPITTLVIIHTGTNAIERFKPWENGPVNPGDGAAQVVHVPNIVRNFTMRFYMIDHMNNERSRENKIHFLFSPVLFRHNNPVIRNPTGLAKYSRCQSGAERFNEGIRSLATTCRFLTVVDNSQFANPAMFQQTADGVDLHLNDMGSAQFTQHLNTIAQQHEMAQYQTRPVIVLHNALCGE